jgi:hypothetical protein
MNPAATEADMEGLIELTRSQGRVCDGPKMTP